MPPRSSAAHPRSADPILALLAPHLEPWPLAQVEHVLRASRAQYRDQGSERSHGAVTRALAEAQRVPEAGRWGTLVDLLHAAVDLADNLADEEEDLAAGRTYTKHYAKVPRATLLCLPTLMVTAASAEAAALAGKHAGVVLERMTVALGRMTHGQGLPTGHRRRAELVSGAFGMIYALPLYSNPRLRARAEVAARWGDGIGVLGHRRIECREKPGRASEKALAAARDYLVEIWPTFAPFRKGEALSAELLLRPAGPVT